MRTKQRIRDAAVVEFAQFGLAAARVDRIAQRAGVNKERLYNYYGDKQQLFVTVLQQELTKLAVAVPLDEEQALDLGSYAGRVFDYHLGHPELLRLLHWEGLQLGGEPVAWETERTVYYHAKVAAVSAAQDAGAIATNPDAAHLLYAVIAMAAWWFAAPQVVRMILGDRANDHEAQRAALVEFVCLLARGQHNSAGTGEGGLHPLATPMPIA